MPVDNQKQYARQNAWSKEHSERLQVRLLHSSDADILEYLETKENKSGYIKSLIRADMERKKNETE